MYDTRIYTLLSRNFTSGARRTPVVIRRAGLVAVVVALLVPAAVHDGAGAATACEHGAIPYAGLPGASMTATDYVSKDDADVPGYNVFTRRDGVIRHFWAGEMGPGSADPGQDPRGAPDIDPLWAILDTTPEGRGKDWYPRLSY